MIILGQTLLELHAGINGTGKGRKGLLSCPHFLNTLQLRQKKKMLSLTNPRGVRVISIKSECMFSITKQDNYQYIKGVANKWEWCSYLLCISLVVHVFLEVILVFGEIKQHFHLPKASCTCDFTVMLIWREPSSIIESLGLLSKCNSAWCHLCTVHSSFQLTKQWSVEKKMDGQWIGTLTSDMESSLRHRYYFLGSAIIMSGCKHVWAADAIITSYCHNHECFSQLFYPV